MSNVDEIRTDHYSYVTSSEIVGVQTMMTASAQAFSMSSRWKAATFKLKEVIEFPNGTKMYHINSTNPIRDWLIETFEGTSEYGMTNSSDRGVLTTFVLSEKEYMALILRWKD